ncbi:MAG: helix-turn-helix domain-containing protein [Bacteroidales bacterium]|nr:helix-turn-helix domain-containing protein [Bacteroidales bacterium]
MRNEGKISPEEKNRIEEWILSKGYRDSIPCHELSFRLHIDAETLNYYFKEYWRMTFRELRCHLRVLEAKDIMVRKPEIPITSVAQMVGIRDRSDFRKAFLRHSGMTPLQWKDAIEGKASASGR